MNEHEFRELSAARALHALSPEQERAFTVALAAHPEWQPIVDEDRETVACLSAELPEVAPPESARAAILAQIGQTPQCDRVSDDRDAGDRVPGDEASAGSADEIWHLAGGSEEDAELGPRSRRRAVWFTLAASLAVMLAISLSVPWGAVAPQPDPVAVALQQIESAADADAVVARLPDGATGALHWSDEARAAVLVTEGMHEAPDGHDYELWIVRGEQRTSLGVMRVESDGGNAVLASGFEPGDALAVTIEEKGGSPSGEPTTDPLFVLPSA